MADSTRLISSLPPLDQLKDDDIFFCMRGSVSYKMPGSVVKALALGGSAYIGYVDGVPYWYVYDPETGGHVQSEKAQGPEGPRITGAAVDGSYHLIITLDDGTEYDAGYVRGPGGAGTGDMLEEDYDPTGDVKAAGGIADFLGLSMAPVSKVSSGDGYTFTSQRIGRLVLVSVAWDVTGTAYGITLILHYQSAGSVTIPAAIYAKTSSPRCLVEIDEATPTRAFLTVRREDSTAETVNISFAYIAAE